MKPKILWLLLTAACLLFPPCVLPDSKPLGSDKAWTGPPAGFQWIVTTRVSSLSDG